MRGRCNGALALVAVISTFFALSLSTTAHAAQNSLLFITAPSHSQINGVFIDDQLAAELSPDGSLGKLLYPTNGRSFRWEVDPALIEEVTTMSNGYKLLDGTAGSGQDLARAFLARLSALASVGQVDAMVYGNPSEYWVTRLTPHEHTSILSASQSRLSALLKNSVGLPTNYLSTSYFSLPKQSLTHIRRDYSTIQGSAIYMAPEALDAARLSLIRLLNPAMGSDRRLALLADVNHSIATLGQNIRLAPGRFTVTSSSQNLPITVINDFPGNAKINLVITSLNERVVVNDINNVAVNGKSKIQVMVPVKVLTSGTSGLSIVIRNGKGAQIGNPQIYPLSLKVISPIATWITTGAAITLFFAALLQSLRRIRRRRVA